MKVIVHLSWLLLTLCLAVMAKFDISPLVRRNLFNQDVSKRYEVINEYLSYKCDETTAVDFLRRYVFIRIPFMKRFVKKLKDCETPVKNHYQLLNPDYYEKLRFNVHLETWLHKAQAIQRIYDIYTLDELSFINISLLNLYYDYLANNLFETITFDDYYAIKIFLSNPEIVNYYERIHCRIMKAMYRLIIRQYDAVVNNKLIKTILYCPANNWNQLFINFEINKLIICSKKRPVLDRIINTDVRNHHQNSKFKAYFKIAISQMGAFVSLENVVEDCQQYVILPGTVVELKKYETFLVDDETIKVEFFNANLIHYNTFLTLAANLAVKYENKCPTPSFE